MAKRKRGNKLERWEIALIKAMLARGEYNDQEILAYSNTWVWYDSWLARVRAHCQEHEAQYK